MRNLFFAAFAAVLLAGCVTGPTALQTVLDAKCEGGMSVVEMLSAQQQQYPDLNIHIENVVTGEAVANELKGAVPGDTITVLGAVKATGEKSPAVLLIVSDKGCVTGQKFDSRAEVVKRGLLSAE